MCLNNQESRVREKKKVAKKMEYLKGRLDSLTQALKQCHWGSTFLSISFMGSLID